MVGRLGSPAPGPWRVSPRTEARITALRGAGRPLPAVVREDFERRFGRPFGTVRLHDTPKATAAARELGARAFTLGSHIAFAPGELRLGTDQGRRLLAHELVHTIQQGAATAPNTVQCKPGPLGDFELELDPSLVPPFVPGQDLDLPEPTLTWPPAPEPLVPPLSLDPPVVREMQTWIQERIEHWNRRIEQRTREYQRRNWALTPGALAPFTRRIRRLETLRDDLVDALPPSVSPEIARRNPRLGARLMRGFNHALTLANVVVNEAGVVNDAAKRAVAYAYLNLTGGAVREPTGAEISGYEELPARWRGMSDTERLTFLGNFIPSLRAARARLQDPSPAATDPTGGATHWVSPIGLDPYDPERHGNDRYSRTVGSARNRAFPNWARDPVADADVVAAMQAAGQLDANYDEIQVPRVPREQFLFYRGVR